MAGVTELILERDGHDQPWGFRLQGGHDVGMPLSIQRILVGTPSEGVLRKGDVLVRIRSTEARGLSHQQAADLFTNTGNTIKIQFKRPGAPAPASVRASASHGVGPPQPVPISGGVALPGMTPLSQGASHDTLLLNLPKTRGGTKPQSSTGQHSTTGPLSLTIQNQPYRTSPLIQPSVKTEVGPGSAQHLKMQSDYLTGAKEVVDTRVTEFTMKQKVTGTLQQLQNQGPSSEPKFNISTGESSSAVRMDQVSSKQAYNSPMGLYSSENVSEVAKLNRMGMSGLPATVAPSSPTGLIHPVNKPTKSWLNMGGLPMKYDPEQSATWQAIHETEKCELVTEHGPTSSKVYSI